MNQPTSTHVEIDLSNLKHNFRLARDSAGGRPLLAVVKADAYGHGAIPVARVLAREGAKLFGVAHVHEARALREAGIEGPILLFCGVPPGEENAVAELTLTPMLFDLALARRLDAVGRSRGLRLPIHLKLDTGMGRVGFRPEELTHVLSELLELKSLDLQGVASHLALADERINPWSDEQYSTFTSCLTQVRSAGFSPRWVHLSNSAGLFGRSFPECNLVRPGICLYGGLPGADFSALDLRPVMHFRSRVAQLKQVPVGTGVSYGHRFIARRPTRLAAVPVGYADGYSRRFTNRGEVLIGGQRAPIVGTVCMNWSLVDVTDLPDVEVGRVVTLLGRDGDAVLTGHQLAEKIDTIDYEIFCQIGSRNPRCYTGE